MNKFELLNNLWSQSMRFRQQCNVWVVHIDSHFRSFILIFWNSHIASLYQHCFSSPSPVVLHVTLVSRISNDLSPSLVMLRVPAYHILVSAVICRAPQRLCYMPHSPNPCIISHVFPFPLMLLARPSYPPYS